jgi:hypothetical protein
LELYPVNQLDVIDVCPLRHVLVLLGLAGADLQSLTAAALLAAVRRSSPQLLTAIEQQQQQQRVTQHVMPSPAQPQQPHVAIHATQLPAAAGRASDASMAVTTQDDSTPMQPDAAAAAAEEATGLAEAGNAGVDAAAAPAAAAAAATPIGFLAALSDYLAEQQQPQQPQPWLLPIDSAALSPPGASTTPIDSNTPPAAACAGLAEPNSVEAAVAAAAEVMAGDAPAAGPATDPDAAAAALSQETKDQAAAAISQPDDQQQQQQLSILQLYQQGNLQQQQQQQRLPVLPSIEVLPCDWAAALAAAGPPASKREMSSLAGLNPAAPLPVPLLPLLLPALARVVLLLHRWLLLGQSHAQQLADAAAAAVMLGSGAAAGGARSSATAAAAGSTGSTAAAVAGSTGGTNCSQLEDLLVQLGTVEQLQAVQPGDVSVPSEATSSAAAAEAAANSSRSVQTNNVGRTAASSSTSSSMVHASGCRCLLLSGHGAAGQPEVAAAVLQLLGAASAAAVHSLSLPAMLLAGDGDVSRGLVCAVREAVARTGRGQLLVLYLARIEVGCRVGLKGSYSYHSSRWLDASGLHQQCAANQGFLHLLSAGGELRCRCMCSTAAETAASCIARPLY